MSRASLLLFGLTLAVPAAGWAQDSQFGIRGLGTPGRMESVRARSTGGALAPFDYLSPLTDAVLSEVGGVTVSSFGAVVNRTNETPVGNYTVRETRFPGFLLAGRVYRHFVIGGGFSTYLDQTYRIVARDTVVIRGDSQVVTDEFRSDGGVSDLHFAVATRQGRRLSVGAGFHLLVGSTRVRGARAFSDTSIYRSFSQQGEIRYEGLGVSASAIYAAADWLSLAAYVRSDGSIKVRIPGDVVQVRDLPWMVGGGIRLAPRPSLSLAGNVTWRNWSVAADSNAFNTLNWSAGVEFAPSQLALRLGVRGGQLPFGPGTAPDEFGASGGIGFRFAHDRAAFDLGEEYLRRSAAGVTETIWTTMAGLTIRP